MSNVYWDSSEEAKLAEYLVSRVSSRASGQNITECLYNYPRDVYFVGNLRPFINEPSESMENGTNRREVLTKIAPMAFGAEFLMRPKGDSTEVGVTVKWACYYRIFPTLAQQQNHQRLASTQVEMCNQPPFDIDEIGGSEKNLEENGESMPDLPEVAETAQDRRHARVPKDSLFIRFRKIPCDVSAPIILNRTQNGHWSIDASQLQHVLDQELARARQIALNDQERIRIKKTGDKIKVPETALVSEEAYSDFKSSLCEELQLEWRWETRCDFRKTDSTNNADHILAIELVNITSMDENSPNIEPFFFETELSVTFTEGEVCAFEIEMAPKGFRYNREVWGRGINCSIKRQCTDSSNQTFVTTHMPIYQQMRYQTRMNPPARFADLAQDPVPTLSAILTAMEEYRQVWQLEREKYARSFSKWEAEGNSEFEHDFHQYEQEIRRFRRGLELIESNPDVRLAFQLTNETFRRGEKVGWRLFQVVFLVSQIPGIAALADPTSQDNSDRELVDIIYFPTGGGKTEAYLATIVFHCFFDRLRGKTAGVTAWTRFPLRLLTLQQTQRMANVISMAELVRCEQRDPRLVGSGIDGFAVGYFVGQGGSPNEIVNPDAYCYARPEHQVTWSKVNDPAMRRAWRRVVRCPSCGTDTVEIEFDESSMRLVHRCTQPTCRFPNRVIPVYVVDNEIYRYLPCVIVGTIDKLAGLGNQRKFALLFGQVDGRCSLHGYFKGRCCQKDCFDQNRLYKTIPRGISGPTLFVQDELHLLKEGLGTFDAHYETFTQMLLKNFGQTQHLKIIASSATIEAFERQVEHLYGRRPACARVFPGPGPTLEQSFYAETLPSLQRLYVGLLPHNKTIFNAILELIEMYHREILILQQLSSNAINPYGGSLNPGTSEWSSLLDLYATPLTYFLASRELNSIRTDLEGDVIPNMMKDGLPPLKISELTGGTSTDDVSKILAELERPAAPGTPPHSVLATSMISHGVDVDRFNTMIFYGMPRQNAEYIQASSRVGRTHVGIVFTCLHPIRERDRSHYSYFVKYHEFLGQLVEPVAINRWSKFSINRTLPGLFMGILLQIMACRSGEQDAGSYYSIKDVKQKLSNGSLDPEEIIALLNEAYQVENPKTSGQIVFHEEISRLVWLFRDYILSSTAGTKFVSEVLIPRPMISLRDVDEAIPIELDSLGTQWTSVKRR
jgi:hypothetical protein